MRGDEEVKTVESARKYRFKKLRCKKYLKMLVTFLPAWKLSGKAAGTTFMGR